jgi:hypothetical protein
VQKQSSRRSQQLNALSSTKRKLKQHAGCCCWLRNRTGQQQRQHHLATRVVGLVQCQVCCHCLHLSVLLQSSFLLLLLLLLLLLPAGWSWVFQPVWDLLPQRSLCPADRPDPAAKPWTLEQTVRHALPGPTNRHRVQRGRWVATASTSTAVAVSGASYQLAAPIARRRTNAARHGNLKRG